MEKRKKKINIDNYRRKTEFPYCSKKNTKKITEYRKEMGEYD